MLSKSRLPSPAFVVALIALFVALSGSAVAASVVPLAKRALFAVNAGKLGGKTAAQIAALPGPPTSGATLVSTKTAPFALGAGEAKAVTVACGTGEKAIAGGFSTDQVVFAFDTLPSSDGGSWQIFLANGSSSAGASGTLYVVCLK